MTTTFARTTESGLSVHPSHLTWRELKTAEGAFRPGMFPGEDCARCGRYIEGDTEEVPDSAANECPGWEGDDPASMW